MAKTKVHGEYLDPSVISGQTQVTAVGADSVLILDATDNALKKALLSDVIETVGSTPTFTSLTVDDITIDGSTISDGATMTLDAGSQIVLDADGGLIQLKDGGTEFAQLKNSSSDLQIISIVDDKDIIFRGSDNGTYFNALTLDMSEAGAATFNSNATVSGIFKLAASRSTYVDASEDASAHSHMFVTNDGVGDFSQEAGHLVIQARTHTSVYRDIIFAGGINNASDLMRITGEGKVGIGTTSPTSVLHVAADSAIITLKDTNGSGNAATPYVLFEDSGGTDLGYVGFGSGGNSTMFVTNYADADLEFLTNSSTRMTIDNSGKVGIGMTPTHQLSVIGTGTATSINFGNVGSSFPDTMGMFTSSTAHTQTAYGDLNIKARTDYGGFYGIGFFTASSNSTPVLRQKINSSGYVTKANQPYIRCAGNSASMAANQGTTADFSNWADQVQRGITRSGATFTVPVAGEYLITYSFYNWINNSGPGTTHAIYLYKGASVVQETVAEYDFENDNYSYYDNQLQNSLILNMAAGDTFKFSSYADVYGGASHTNMSAYLLG